MEFRLYPNPVISELTIESASDMDIEARIIIIDVMGQIERSQILNLHKGVQNNSLDIRHLTAGVYTLMIQVDGNQINKKFIKLN